MPRAMTNDAERKTDNDDGPRVYTHPVTDEQWRSVTTILKAQNKPQLNKWKVNTVSSFAADNRESLAQMERDAAYDLIRSSQYTASSDSANMGNRVHGLLENLALGNSVIIPPELQHVATMWRELNEEFEIRTLHAEATLINRTVGYAGSGDLIVMIRPRGSLSGWKRAVIDAKSGKGIYGSVALQLVAYAKAEFILSPDGSEEPMPPIHETYALHIRPRSWALKPMMYTREVWETFQALVKLDHWEAYLERDAVGAPVNAGAIARMRKTA